MLLMPGATLNSWNQEFDEKLQPLIIPDHRGKNSKVTVDVVRKVVEAAKSYKLKYCAKKKYFTLKCSIGIALHA